jgi:oligosaccharyltransferase complex subunit alpha (ribophorin I)
MLFLLELSILFWALLPVLVSASHPFENSAILQNVVLGGPIVEVTTTYTLKALEPEAQVYKIALGAEERSKTSWLEVHVKGKVEKQLPIEDLGLDSSG